MSTQDARVVITGLGCLSPVGNDPQAAFDALLEGRSGIAELTCQPDPDCRARIAGEVRDFDGREQLGEKKARRLARFAQLAVVASRGAVSDADLKTAGYEASRIGVIAGVGFGGLEMIARAVLALRDHGLRRVDPYAIPATIPSMAAGAISIEHGAEGPSLCTAAACASGAHALGEALAYLRRGEVDAMIAGGSEACVSPIGLANFDRMGALAKGTDNADQASRPFDRRRDGFVMAEGAAMFVLERMDHARRRGAHIYAELAGHGSSSDAVHQVKPSQAGTGAAHAMQRALASAGLSAESIDYVNAHGTGTVENDAMETRAIRRVFGPHADRLWVSSTKGATGHMLGAAGAFEAMVVALCIAQDACPPTLNLELPDPECDLDYLADGARRGRLRAALSNSFAFGGHNSSLVLRSV